MLTIVPAGVSGQQAYLSNVLLQNRPTEQVTEGLMKKKLRTSITSHSIPFLHDYSTQNEWNLYEMKSLP